MKQEILTRLKSSEDETTRRVEKAKESATEIAKVARRRADEILREAADEAQRDQANQLGIERSKLQKEREQVLAQGAAKEKQMRASYEKRVDEHVKKAVEAFARSLNA